MAVVVDPSVERLGDGQRPIGLLAALLLPLVTHQSAESKEPINPRGVRSAPPSQLIAQGQVGFRWGLVSGGIACKESHEGHAVAGLPGGLEQLVIGSWEAD